MLGNLFDVYIPRALRPRWGEAHKTFEAKRKERENMTKEERELLDKRNKEMFEKLKLED